MALYQKHRPAQFSALAGQELAVRLLQQAILKQQISHAYLFSGPRGTGKTSSARLFAQTVCCLSPIKTEDHVEPCGQCLHCQEILSQASQDLIEIDAASNRGIDDIRSLKEQVQYPPALLPRRIYIIDEAHMLTSEAFNALLKTLEEPPSQVMFILATTELHKVPLTVKSRCQIIQFKRGSEADIAQTLKQVVKLEKLKVEPAALDLIAAHAEGGFRDALSLLEQLSTREQPLSAQSVQLALGLPSQSQITSLITAIMEGDQSGVALALSNFACQPDLKYDLVLLGMINSVRGLEPTTKQKVGLIEALLESYILQKSSPIPQLPLELACWKMVDTSTVNVSKLSPNISEPKRSTPEAESPRSEPKPLSIAHTVTQPKPDINTLTVNTKPEYIPLSTSVPVVELREIMTEPTADLPEHPLPDWRKFFKQAIDILSPDDLHVAQLLKGCTVYKITQQRLEVHCKYKFHLDKLNDRKCRRLIESALEQAANQKIELQFSLENSIQTSPKPALASTKPSEKPALHPPNEEKVSPQVAAEVFNQTV